MHLEQITERLQGTQTGGIIVIARNNDRDDIVAGELRQGLRHQFLGSERRASLVKDVPGHQDSINVLAPGNINDLGKHRPVLIYPRAIANSPAYVPVRGVKKPHARILNTRFLGLETASKRVAAISVRPPGSPRPAWGIESGPEWECRVETRSSARTLK